MADENITPAVAPVATESGVNGGVPANAQTTDAGNNQTPATVANELPKATPPTHPIVTCSYGYALM